VRLRRHGRPGRPGERRTVTYQIVGDDEADLKNNKISISSPIARALIGKDAGDIAEVATPGGKVSYEIDATRHQ
jgi:transcription elongation factor GreA